jgi:transcription termination factor NusB
MIKVLGENYYIDLDKIEEYLDMSNQYTEGETSGNTETRINIIKFEMVKMLVDTILTEHEEIDEQLGMKSSSNTSIPFRLAFNSLLNKKLINHY